MDLKGKRGVILGVANERSIAWSIAKAAHRQGAQIILNYQSERLEAKVKELASELEGTQAFVCDLSREEELDQFFEKVSQAFDGKLDFLVHSVAFADRKELSGRFVDTSSEGFRLALDVSCYTLVGATRHALPLFEKAGGGSVITLSYYGAEKVIPNYNVMGVAKAALEAAVRYLAADLGPDNIRVNAVSAGPINTLAARGIKNMTKMLPEAAERSPMRRNTEQAEVADMVAFLASDAARGITGDTIYVDNGYHIMGF